MSLQTEIERPTSHTFRHADIQRRATGTATYDGVWRNIDSYVKKWGTLESSLDDVRFSKFTDKGITLVVNNDSGAFNHHSNASSLWNGYLGRYRTLVRIQSGYYDTNLSSELPTDPTLGVFILDSEIAIKSNSNDVYLRCSSLKSVFDEVRVRDIARLFTSATWTPGDIVAVIRDHSDGAGSNVFRQFITSSSWTIDSTSSNNYLLTTTVAENMTAWGFLEKLAEAEGRVVMINRTGGFEYRTRAARQGTAQFTFTGQGFPRPTVIEIEEYKESWDKFYNFFRLKYLEADTSTSYVSAGTNTTVNVSNTSWLYGSRVYEFENRFPNNTATAQAIVDNLFSISSAVPLDLTMRNVFIPHLELLDRVGVSYRSYDLANNAVWDGFVWDTDRWGQEGVNFDFQDRAYFILSQRHDLDNFTTRYAVREI